MLKDTAQAKTSDTLNLKSSILPFFMIDELFSFGINVHARIQRGSKVDKRFFLVDEGRQHPTIKMVFRWRADDGPTLNADFKAL